MPIGVCVFIAINAICGQRSITEDVVAHKVSRSIEIYNNSSSANESIEIKKIYTKKLDDKHQKNLVVSNKYNFSESLNSELVKVKRLSIPLGYFRYLPILPFFAIEAILESYFRLVRKNIKNIFQVAQGNLCRNQKFTLYFFNIQETLHLWEETQKFNSHLWEETQKFNSHLWEETQKFNSQTTQETQKFT